MVDRVPDGEASERCRICGGVDSEVLVEGIRDWEFEVPGEWRYQKCRECGQIQIGPFPDLALLKRAYPSEYTAHETIAGGDRGALYRLLHRLNRWATVKRLPFVPGPGMRLLDVGCGNGGFLGPFRNAGVTELHGVDFSADACRAARHNGITAEEGLFLDFPPSGATARFDVIFMNHYLEHVLDPREELAHAHSLLKPGGWIVGEMPNFDAIERSVWPRHWGGNHVPRHTFQFTAASLGARLGEAGFREIRIGGSMNSGEMALTFQNRLVDAGLISREELRRRRARAPWFDALMLALAPPHALISAFGRGGLLRFQARRV
jgi:2-polyprenyl-3-methyl-5-hydroxy-6-metoxy-1,4-benzoquinol methylase